MTYEVQWEKEDRAQVLDVAQVVALEQAIAADGTSLAELMDRAGASAARFIQDRWQQGSKVLIFCGTGNNGGDGWVVGQLLVQAGYTVTAVCSHEPESISAQPAHDAALRCVAEVGDSSAFSLAIGPNPEMLQRVVSGADVIVDALLGTGFHYETLREPTQSYVAAIVDAMRSEQAPSVVAIDVPSGLNAQTGKATDPVVHADYTVTMMTLKTGLVQPAARKLCGQIAVARIADIEKYLA